MLPGKTYTPDDFAQIAWRRKWVILLPFLVIAIGTVVVAHYLPNKYRSETVILVVPQQVPENYVRSAVTTRLEDRLQSINQQILSRTRLERIIQDFNLYAKERADGIMEDIVERMRTKDIKVDVLKGEAFRIAYIGDHPMVTMRVTERLASLFIEENLRDRELLAQGTNQFLSGQLDDARRQLIEQEKKLEAYRALHSGELPSQAANNLQAAQNVQMQIQAIVESLNRDADRRIMVERALADLNANPPVSTGTAEDGGQSLPAAVQLAAAKKQLTEMQLRLRAEHPDVIRMKRRITGLEQRVETEALTSPLSPDTAAAATPADVAYRTRVRVLQLELEKLDRDMASKQAQEQRLRKNGEIYQARVEAVPARETDLAELTRDYETLQRLYTGLLTKSQESKIAANLERRQIGEQLKVIDSARPAERPFSPNRIRINLMGLFGGMFMGLALAGFLEYRDASFRTQDDVSAALGLPVLAQIPMIVTRTEAKRLMRRRVAIAGASVSICAIVGAVLWRLGIFHGLLALI